MPASSSAATPGPASCGCSAPWGRSGWRPWQPGQAQLQDAQGLRQFADLASLARESLGEDIPLAALPDWLAARPWPALPATSTPEGFAQAGWRIDTRAAAQGEILAQRDAPPALNLRVRLDR